MRKHKKRQLEDTLDLVLEKLWLFMPRMVLQTFYVILIILSHLVPLTSSNTSLVKFSITKISIFQYYIIICIWFCFKSILYIKFISLYSLFFLFLLSKVFASSLSLAYLMLLCRCRNQRNDTPDESDEQVLVSSLRFSHLIPY